MRRLRRLLGWGAVALAAVLLVVVGAVFFLNRTERGQRFALDFVLERIEATIDGEVTVDSVRSSALLRGATLYGVRVLGPEGRPLLEAESLRATYAWRTFLRGDVVLSGLDVFGARLTISRYPGEERFNVDRALRPEGRPEPDSAAPAGLFRLDRVRLVDASVEILQPVDPEDPPPERALITTVPGVEGAFQRMFFEDVQAWMPEVLVSAPDLAGPRVAVDSLSMTGHLYEDPFVLTHLQGMVSWVEGRLTVAADELVLPDTRASGTIVADFTAGTPDGAETTWAVSLDLQSPAFSLADLRWLLPDLPLGTGEGSFRIAFDDLGDVRVAFSDASLVMDGSRLAGSGTIVMDAEGELTFEDVRLTSESLALARLEPFTGELPVSGTLAGRVALDGTLANLRAEGVLTLREPGYQPTTGRFDGTFHLLDDRGVTELALDLAPVDYGLLAILVPDSRLAGGGRAQIRATGTLSGGIRYEADLQHQPRPGLPLSQIQARGTFRGDGRPTELDLEADVSPLSLTTLREYFPDLPLSGEVTGRIRATGPLSDLRITTDLETEAGRLALEGRVNAEEPGAFYSLEGELGDFALSRLVPELPDPTTFTGYVRVEGRGTDLRTASVDLLLRARDSRVWELQVDTAEVALRVRDGALAVDAAYALVSGVELRASGSLATTEEGPAGQVRVIFAADSLAGLRTALEAGDVLVRDGLTRLERDALRAQGVDPDTLPGATDVRVAGRVSGDVTLTGSLERFSAEGVIQLDELRYQDHFVSNAQVTFDAGGLPDFGETLEARVVSDALAISGMEFQAAEATVDFARPAGFAEVHLVRSANEDYRAAGTFALDSLGGSVDLSALEVRMDTVSWRLQGPAQVAWDAEAVRVANLVVAETGGGGVRIVASGVLPRDGEADFALEVDGLELSQVARLAQVEAELSGLVALDLRVRGTSADPFVGGTLEASDVRYQGYQMDRVAGEVEYLDRRVALDLEAWEGALRVLRATGEVPLVLTLDEPSVSLPDEEIALLVVADSLPAAFVTGYFRQLSDVEGTVAGTFDIGGTINNPEPSGSLTLQNAAWTLEAIGVRHENVRGTLTLRRDATVEVDATAEAEGTARMTGSVLLAPLTNPTFDLVVSFDDFRAVDRRDTEGNVSGIVRLTGPFDQPFIRGLGPAEGLRVQSGVLYLEEFVRALTVVDLADPRFSEFFEESLPERQIADASANPFMDNLRINVDLAVAQDTWLRSPDMNVEITGDLSVAYDRLARSVVLTGVLDAERGSYTVLGRRFQVVEGAVQFLGIPGIDPDLNIEARTRVRRQDGDPLDITARVTGTLTQPRVVLASDEAAISESDLVSFVLFGRPSYALAASQQAALTNVAGSFVGAAAGTFANRIGNVLATPLGLDYFAITEIGDVGFNVGWLTQTQVEFGRYLNEDLFLVMAFQPTQVVGPNPFGTFGLRLEFTPTDDYTLEAFWEDRFLRNPALGFQDVVFNREKILGLFLFTEWGY